MSRIYECHESSYYGGDLRYSMDEYPERTNRMQRTPTVFEDFADVPHVHKFQHNNSACGEKHDDHHQKIPHVNHHHHAPEMHKNVHFSEHIKTVEVGRDGNRSFAEEKTIDAEADGFIKQGHKNFESFNTFKQY